MTDESSRERILKAVKKRIKDSDDKERTQIISNAIGDRRDRDLVDIIAQIEQDDGWSSALEYLMRAEHRKYTSPITMGSNETALEKLKYREVVFGLLSCSGLEPVPMDTSLLLKELDSETSLVDASRSLVAKLEDQAINQIGRGDTLFFDFTENISISQETVDMLQRTRNKKIGNISLKQGEAIEITPLWYCELGRLALANLGIKGTSIPSDTFDRVSSVIHEPISLAEESTEIVLKDQQNVDGLGKLASRHALPTLNVLLDEASSLYKDSQSATGFKEILHSINAHIAVRTLSSLIALEKTSQMTNTRIATLAILAIGNFYHESATSTLVDILCISKKREIMETVTQSIITNHKFCPEADYVISNRLDRECTNRGKLLKLQKLLLKKKNVYYQ
ncbi:MAG: hypothetical protein ACW99G_24370 [Candidatus Thorarchaeota archaeon]